MATGSGNRSGGFTLTEIMIAVAIIVVLAAIAIPSYRHARNKAWENQTEADLGILSAAVKQLVWDTRRWPGGTKRVDDPDVRIDDLSLPTSGLLEEDPLFPNWDGPYAREVNVDPWGNKYFFDSKYDRGDGTDVPVVGSYGPNGSGDEDSDNIISVVD